MERLLTPWYISVDLAISTDSKKKKNGYTKREPVLNFISFLAAESLKPSLLMCDQAVTQKRLSSNSSYLEFTTIKAVSPEDPFSQKTTT